MHQFPQVKNTGAVAVKENEKRRKSWIKFVKRHRHDFEASASSMLCSAHFESSCFTANLDIAKICGMRRRLKTDAVPTIDIAGLPTPTAPATDRARRRVSLIVQDDNEHASGQQDGESGHGVVDDSVLEPSMRNCDGCDALKEKIRGLQKTISRLRIQRSQQDTQAETDSESDTVDHAFEDALEDADTPSIAPSSPCEEEELLEAADHDEDYDPEEESATTDEDSSAAGSDEDEVYGEGSSARTVT
ncbi:THAP2 [Branchiostoma lanceolatum]|uniref:THAP2 protein n=1 Tax=Branchiostoma lanceolatum TaxID=7740 RepID=A0A8J9YV66_BRALA|nr:THAP2 [Branchiostoma lanceolatum]